MNAAKYSIPVRRRRGPKPVEDTRPPQAPPTANGFVEIASRSTSITELRLLWRNAKDMGLLTDELKIVLRQQSERVTK